MKQNIKSKPVVLVVDDVPSNIDILIESLEEEYDLRVALSGEKALEVMARCVPDIVFLDLMMPEMDGYQVLNQIRQNSAWKNIPIIFLTAKDSNSDEAKGIEMGAVDYITKPFSIQTVRARLKNHLALKFAREELEIRNKRLNEAFKVREDMTNMIIHDMRNPLGAIKSYVEMSQMYEAEEHAGYLKIIGNFAKQLDEFINDMLILAKTESNTIHLSLEKIDMENLLKSVLFNHERSLELKDIDLETETTGVKKSVLLDPKLFFRVLDNLISNAIKYSPSSSLIKILCDYSCEKFYFKISDQGPGVSPKYQDSIFESFQIAKLHQSGVHQLGLGLAFCKKVVVAHGGKIWIENNKGKGSTFVVKV